MIYNVMLVDDEQFTRKGLRSLIDWNSCGFEVVEEADNGEDALQLIQEKKPDIVITDIRMPVLDGLELIRAVTEQHATYSPPAFIIISGYNDFKYAQQAVRYGVHDFILKPIDQEEMTQTLISLHKKLTTERQEREKSEELLIGSIIETLIKAEASPEMVAIWEDRLHHADSYQYLFVELNDVHPWLRVPTNISPHDFKQYTQSVIRRLFPDFKQVFLHEHRGRLGIMVSNILLKGYDGSVTAFIEDLKKELTQRFGNRVYFFVGQEVDALTKIQHSYQTAKDTLMYKYLYDESKIIVYDQVSNLQLNFVEADRAIHERLLEQIEEEKTQELQETVDQLFDDFLTKRFAPEAIKMNIHQCVTSIIKTIKDMDGDEQQLATLEPIISWHDLNLSLGELKRLFINFVSESSQLLKKLRKEYVKGGIQKIKHYIEANYNKNISLKSIASVFYMNPVYLGQLFKKNYGMYFNEYLLQLRVNEAKKLLRQTDLRIYEIAEKVGFSNADYFVTQFDKIERLTPSEYRNKHRQ